MVVPSVQAIWTNAPLVQKGAHTVHTLAVTGAEPMGSSISYPVRSGAPMFRPGGLSNALSKKRVLKQPLLAARVGVHPGQIPFR